MGFKDWRLLEDVEMTERLRHIAGPPLVVQRSVRVSPRRWAQLGLLRTFLLNQYILCAWKWGGVHPDQLADVYHSGESACKGVKQRR